MVKALSLENEMFQILIIPLSEHLRSDSKAYVISVEGS